MFRHPGSTRRLWLSGIIVGLTLGLGHSGRAQRADRAAPDDPAAAEEAREQRATERFLSLLEKNPRRGTALDRVYGYHVERGSLDTFIKSYRDRLEKAPNDGAAWLILGLLEFQRGQDAAAVAALRQAEANRADDPLPAYYLGQALVLVGQPEQAAAAFERALRRKPARNDLLEIFQALGRVYQRTQKDDQALAVWGRLEALFPDDPRVQEQIASALAEEDQPARALPRFEALARKVPDPFRQVQLAMKAAELKVRLGRSDEALGDFERMLANLRPDSWLHKEVRRKIEEVFLRNDDQAGLVSYYERWTKKEPEDIEALVRLGRTLAGMGRVAEAQGWYEKAIKLAPSRRELRLALISQLAQDQKYAEAAAQYEAMDRSDPNNPDTLRDWGALVLRDPSTPQAERKAAAAAIWRKLLDARPNDPVTTAQVADLLRQAERVDDALALYRKASEQAPGNPQYDEYLGEYLHQLKRPAEALAAWGKIADGSNRTAKNLSRLAEVLAGFGYLKEALGPLAEAVNLEKDDFGMRLKLAGLSHQLEKFDDAEAQLAVAAKLAEKDEEKAAILEARVKNDQAAGRLAMRVDQLQKEVGGAKEGTAERWGILARYLEADGKLPEAVQAAGRSIEADPRSIAAWALAARLRESAGNLADAADALRRLTEIDRKNRAEYLTGIAKLESRLGRIEAALKAGRDLITAAPGNPEHYEFFAQLCFQLGRSEEGLDALRRAARVNPNDTKVSLNLAETLAGLYRTDEAIEMYWRAFDKAEDLDGKLGVVSKLTELYLQRNQFDRLLTRLQHQERDARPGVDAGQAQRRDVAICMAQAYAASGDMGSARAELEPLLAANTRDVQLLQQLSKLAEEEGDIEGAARYQKQLNELAPSDDGQNRLAHLYTRYGDLEEAQAVWSKMASGKGEVHRVFQAVDSLLANRKYLPVLETTEAMIRKDPRDWEALYRRGLALASSQKPEEAVRQFRALLALNIADDEKSAAIKARSRDPKLKSTGARASSMNRPTVPLEDRLSGIFEIRAACKLDSRERYYAPGTQAPTWAPPDFGQARMAALGWLVSLAQTQGQAKANELVAGVRQSAEKMPADPRALWDWFYLGALRYDNPGVLAAGRALSRATPTDPLALWAYLYSLGSRHMGTGQQYYATQGQDPKDATPPLEKDELEHVLSCYRSLRTRRPEMAQAQILQYVAAELKRAKRVEDAETFYREAIAGATQLAQIAGVFGLAAQRGDVEALIQLSDRYERLQTGRGSSYYYTGTFYFGGSADSVAQGMGVRAGEKAYDDVLRLLDHELAAVRRKQERQSPGAARAARSRFGSQANSVPQYQIWVGKISRYMQITFPTPNEYFDANAIRLLRTAYELYKRDDLLSDLVDHFRRQADAAKTPADAVYPRLALSSILWWNDDKDEAIAEFTKVAEASKAESDLRLDLAELLEQQGQRGDALTLVDGVQPLDNSTMRRREELALRLTVTSGDLDRARQAAERLFGLRLDTDTQVRLAGQMHQLGLHELAEAVLGRARRRAGNKATALVGMMLQYQTQGKLDVAVQVAMQILHSTTATRQTNPNIYYAEDPDASRTSAIAVLARSGRLPQLIDKAKEQLNKTPNAIQIHQALADYYKAAGQRDQARAELTRMIELRPDDNNLRLQVAQQLVQEGQPAAAIDHYKVILKKDPALVGRNFSQVQRVFQQARKMDELLGLLEEMDLRQLGSPSYAFNMINYMMQDPKLRDRVMPLVRKIWDAFPDNRSNLLTFLRRDELWQMPEMYDYAMESVVPKPASFVPGSQWDALGQILSYSADGRMTSALSRLLDLAGSQGRLEELGARIDEARKAMPAWTAGQVVRALIDCRLGRYDQSRAAIRQFLDTSRDQGIPNDVFSVIGTELEGHAPTRDLAVAAYETSINEETDNTNRVLRSGYGPAARLVKLYARENRREDARRILIGSASKSDTVDGAIYPAGYLEQMRMQSLGTAAAQLLELGFAADAVTFYSESLAVARDIPAGAPNYIGDSEGMAKQYRDGLNKAIEQLKPEELAAMLARSIRDEDATPEKAKGGDSKKPDDRGGASAKPKQRDQFIDLMVMVHPRELDKATVRSFMADAIAPAPASPASTASGETKGREQLAASMEDVRRKHPEDLSVAIAEALLAFGSGEDRRIEAALDRLGRLVEKTPLDPLPDGARANARQRTEAARQVPLWLVARACWKRNDAAKLAGIADRLADRALEAARRLAENQTRLAMLRERGEIRLAQGDRKGAEAAWRTMLGIVVETGQPKAKPSKPKPPAVAPPPAATSKPRATSMTPRSPARPAIRLASFQAEKTAAPKAKATSKAKAASPRSPLPILTLERFEQAMQIARLAAEHDMPELSVDAVRESLRAGPPVVPAAPTDSMTRRVIVRSSRGLDDGGIDQVSPRVVAYMVELERLWQRHHVPAESVYQALREAVLPQARPTEIFLYASALNANSLRRPQSVGAALASSAVRAGKVDDVRRVLATRQGQVMAELPAAILSTQLAIAAGDPARAKEGLQAIAARLKNDSSRTSAELACHAALPALNQPSDALSAAAIEVLDGCVKGFESSTSVQGEPLGTLLIMMARRQFQLGDAPGGRKRLEAYLEAMEKNTARYANDYPLYLRKQQLQRVAGELARAGLWSDALAQLARYFDAPAYSGGDPPVDDVLVRLMRRMATLPARERYDTLHAWTMPTKDRRVVRLLTSLAARDMAPDVFARAESRPPAKAEPAVPGGGDARPDLVSTATALIDAARQAGTLDQLADEARAAAEPSGAQTIENADVLYLLVELARGQGAKVATRIEARLAGLIKENEAHPVEPPAQPSLVVRAVISRADRVKFPWTDYLLARSMVQADQPIGGLGLRLTEALVDRAERVNDWSLIGSMRGELAEARARRAGAPDVLAGPGLASWHATDLRPGSYLSTSEPAPYWVAHQGHVVHPSGSTTDLLLFDYPLTGSYEFSVDAYAGPWAHSVVAHNGLGILPTTPFGNGAARVFVLGHTELLVVPWRLSRTNGFNRVTVQATPRKVRYLVNGHLFHEDEPNPTSPWLGLISHRERYSAWRNLTLQGEPVIPREVRLTQGDRLEGWVSSFFLESRPPRWGEESSDQYASVTRVSATGTLIQGIASTTRSRAKRPKEPVKLDDYDWASQDGVIHGRRVAAGTTPRRYVAYDPDSSGTEADQSRLYYQRPLRDGDSIDYEFLYEPGQVMVHPSIDRVAFLLEPEGVKVHWITAGGGDRTGLTADNAVEEPGNRRGPKAIPLKPGTWNAIRVALDGNQVTLSLNGQVIHERTMEPTLGRQFGLFHYKDQTAVQARNLVLRGRWPESLTSRQLANLLAPDPAAPHSDSDRRARHAVIGEPIFALQAGEIAEETGKLPPEERYNRLAGWVLPSPDHPVFRLEGDFTPSFPATSTPTPGSAGVRLQTGGEIRAPALEMVDTAKTLGQLDELAARVEKAQVPDDANRTINERGKRSLLAMIQIARGDDVAAAKSIEAIKPMLEKIPLDPLEWARWPELALASRAIERPALRRSAIALLETLAAQAGKTPPGELWTQQVKNRLARAELLLAVEKGEAEAGRPFGTDPDRPFWARVTSTRAETRGEGRPVAHWSAREGRLTHYPGHDQDRMDLTVPLRGEFQLDCELTSAPGREIRVMYGGLAVGPKSDLKHLERSQFGRPLADLTLNPPLEKPGDWYLFRLSVKGGRATILINNRKVHEAPVPADGDPWLALVCSALQSGGARKIAITGDPQIPEKLNLSTLPDLSGWRADEYNETATGDTPDWDKNGEEIVGRLVEDRRGSEQESVLRYHRPMVEDGRIAYEFYYDPGKVMAHPALDRLAFLLEPDGVKTHWLTDGAHERSGLSPDNNREEPENHRGPASVPLKPGAWNRLVLSVTGDRVALQLNDQAIYERTLELNNQRSFGLFHYADETQVRVRNVTYQGHWPRSLPTGLRPAQ